MNIVLTSIYVMHLIYIYTSTLTVTLFGWVPKRPTVDYYHRWLSPALALEAEQKQQKEEDSKPNQVVRT